MTNTVSPRITAKIAALLATAQQEVRAGNIEAAKAVSATANEVATEDGRVRIYLTKDRRSPRVEQMLTTPDYCVPEQWSTSAREAWASRFSRAASAGMTLNPSGHVVVAFIHTGIVDKNGAHEFLPDWADCTDATSLAEPRQVPA